MPIPNWLKQAWLSDQWKRVFAWTVVYGYVYNCVLWQIFFWVATMATLITGTQWPAPPLVPWEQLVAMSATLGLIGGIELFKKPESRNV